MAEDTEQSSKTEDATPRKLQQAREKGDVPKSQDVAPFAALAAATGVLAFAGGPLSLSLGEALTGFVREAGTIDLAGGGAADAMRTAVLVSLPILGSVMLAAAAGGAAGNLIQHGLLWSPDKLKPDLKKVNPLEGFKRLFGPDALIQFGKTFIKLAAVGAVAWYTVRDRITGLERLPALDVMSVLPLARDLSLGVATGVLALLGTVAGLDFLIQRVRFAQRMKMTREELKDDHKQSEGDPYIKARLKQQRMERSRRRMMQAVPTATVVVMNPTHFAVALRYEPGEDAAPVCVAKGVDAVALRIRDLARDSGVAVVEDPPLARALHAAVDIDDAIPREHFEAVAKVIGFVLSGTRQRAAPALGR